MRKILLFCFLLFGLNVIGQKKAMKPTKEAIATIISPNNATERESYAAQVLSKYLSQISGMEVPINKYNGVNNKSGQANFYVGSFTPSSSIASFTTETKAIKNDGFLINIKSGNVYIVGNANTNGVLNGVYYLLEEFFGCRFYSSNQVVIPEKKAISLPDTKTRIVNPSFSYRALHFPEMYNKAYREWNMISFRDDIFGKVGDYTTHTLSVLLPKELFKNNPSYFALHKGKRTANHPCLSHPKTYEIVRTNLKKAMDKDPYTKYWSVSQPDNQEYCECDKCMKKYREHGGSYQATILNFVNKLALDFPDKTISTLAYSYSITPPKGITLQKNVNIMLCNYNLNRDLKLSYGNRFNSFEKLLASWTRITNNIFVWDYVTQFTHFLAPYPNYYEFEKNLKLFKQYNVAGVYAQGSGKFASEFDELKAYLFSKLLWNIDSNSKQLTREFIESYYGNASQEILMYIDELSSNFIKSGQNLRMMGSSLDGMNTYLDYESLLHYEGIIKKGLGKVSSSKVYKERVLKILVTVQYSILQVWREQYASVKKGKRTTQKGIRQVDLNGSLSRNTEVNKRLDEFLMNCRNLDIKYINNSRRSLATYREYFNE